ncbi:unnamed protein product [Candida verbasci]|uniref:Uncharacterized protein n=1 Tax=Candida verbasci TaxID=1227364 RepID=A0A9W4XF46_9ASCO|nr:unnamed protein product [Candida verbasci]
MQFFPILIFISFVLSLSTQDPFYKQVAEFAEWKKTNRNETFEIQSSKKSPPKWQMSAGVFANKAKHFKDACEIKRKPLHIKQPVSEPMTEPVTTIKPLPSKKKITYWEDSDSSSEDLSSMDSESGSDIDWSDSDSDSDNDSKLFWLFNTNNSEHNIKIIPTDEMTTKIEGYKDVYRDKKSMEQDEEGPKIGKRDYEPVESKASRLSIFKF